MPKQTPSQDRALNLLVLIGLGRGQVIGNNYEKMGYNGGPFARLDERESLGQIHHLALLRILDGD